jgi:alanyl-tRNA synthetase
MAQPVEKPESRMIVQIDLLMSRIRDKRHHTEQHMQKDRLRAEVGRVFQQAGLLYVGENIL